MILNKKLFVLLLILSSFVTQITAQDTNDTSTFLNKKRVMATYNLNNILGDEYSNLQAFKYDYTLGMDEKSLKNKYKTSVSEASLQVNLLELKDAIEVELRTAKMYGIDVFKVKYNIFGSDKYKHSFKKLLALTIQIAEEKNIDFSFCVDVFFPKNKKYKYTHEQLFSIVSNELGQIYGTTKMSEKWLRDTQGRIVLFTGNTKNIINYTRPDGAQKLNKKDIKTIKTFFDDLNDKSKLNIVPVYHVQTYKEDIQDEIIFHFDAVTHSFSFLKNLNDFKKLKEKFTSNNVKFFPHIYLNYMPNSFIHKESGRKVYVHKKYSIDDTYLLAYTPSGTQKFRELLDISFTSEIELLNLSSWNLYNQSNNLNPEIHNGYALSALLGYYTKLWEGKFDKVDEEMTYVAFRNLNREEVNNEKKFTVRNKVNSYDEEGLIEIVTLLNYPAKVYVNNKYLGDAKGGIDAFYIKKEGEMKINVKVKREGKKVIDFTSPKTFTGHKYKFDPLVYITSSIDDKKSLELSDIILNSELSSMGVRFLLSDEGKAQWKTMAQVYFIANRKAILQYGDQPEVYKKIRDKNYEKFKLQIKKILNEFEYKIWEELENDRINEKGLEEDFMEQDNGLKGYNILE
ncbi:glycoside hydrolase family 71/99 protein [Flammeovirga aprica]|uniref:Uncharacterized protein n=1 Tax=Flammeovirga aprica JL-4 TaxID=694437 RepID=A0A7X9RXT7_9BACT|nr:hypothetical protein [Flammeovirga aprica]NME70716.1 hypothetical protein [Flammeovirga aprica JL-4]